MNELQDQLGWRYWVADTIKQVFGASFITRILLRRVLKLSRLQVHIFAERAKMTKGLWFDVMNHYDWTSAQSGIRNYRNQEPGKPKMEVDHVVPLAKFGATKWSNLQVLTGPENRWKGTRIL